MKSFNGCFAEPRFDWRWGRGSGFGERPQDVSFFVARWIIDLDLHQKTIELRFWQRIDALVFQWILRGDDKKRLWQRRGVRPNRRLSFLHGFQEGALHFGRGAVDLVGEQNLSEDRTRAERELAIFGIEDLGAE